MPSCLKATAELSVFQDDGLVTESDRLRLLVEALEYISDRKEHYK